MEWMSATAKADRSPQRTAVASEQTTDAGLPAVIDALSTDALDERAVGLDLRLRLTRCLDGALDERSSATAQTEALAVGGRGRALVHGGGFTDGRWRLEDGFARSAAVDLLQYALWFVETAPDGTQAWSHANFGGVHGERVGYRVPALRRAVEVGGMPRELLVGSKGGIRGRWREDGAVDLLVDAHLWQSLVEPAAPRSGEIGRSGTHAFRVEPGQVLRLDFEPQIGQFALTDADGTPHEASLESLRAGHERALLVSVTSAQASR